MSDILSKIEAYKRQEIATRQSQMSSESLKAQIAKASPVRGFLKGLKSKAATDGIALIAEVKKASPSKGLIREDFDPPVLAKAYEQGGAACISVLTDGPSFQGHDNYLVAARNAVALPAIRKDFLYEPWQVLESRSLNADCILVILSAVDQATALALIEAAHKLNMDALVEVHDEDEMNRALDLPSPLIGINNRNLRTFETSLETFESLAPMVNCEHFLIAESGISSPEDVKRVRDAGARGLLVGESLMRKDDVEMATRDLLAPAP
jgi:indole-3-glycerol phosphate synthase